jgi:shikimate dehydrogenase
MTPSHRRCAVLGSPIRHSLSPVLHRAAYADLGLDWTYDAHDVVEAALPAFLDGLDASWRGLSLTMPLKRVVLPLLDGISASAERSGAVNTVLLDAGRRVGENTDIPGAAAALRERYDGPVDAALVLGGGATAASTGVALVGLGCRRLTIAVRDPARAAQTRDVIEAESTGLEVDVVPLDRVIDAVGRADVLVSTVPVAAQPPLLPLVDRVGAVLDVVYDPWPTPIAVRAGQAGRVLVSGLDLLVHQAALQVELMTGLESAPLSVLRAAGEAELALRASAG